MNEIERKVDMLISGMKLPKKKTRRRVATIATTLLIAIALIASASLIGFYVKIEGEVTVEHLLILDETPVAAEAIISETLNAVPGCTTSESHTIALNPNYDATTGITVYFHITVTEDGTEIPNDGSEGLTVEVWNGNGSATQISISAGTTMTFTIHVMADKLINTSSTYGYTIKMDWNQPG